MISLRRKHSPVSTLIVPFVPCKLIIVLEHIEQPVPNIIASKNNIISVKPHVCTFDKLDMDECFIFIYLLTYLSMLSSGSREFVVV